MSGLWLNHVVGSATMRARRLVRPVCIAALATVMALLTVASAAAQAAVDQQTIEEHPAGADIDFSYPRIGIPGDDAMLRDLAHSLLDQFKTALAARTSSEPPYSAQLSNSVTRNDDTAVVVVFDYSLYTGGAHPNSARMTFNFLMPDGARVFLPDLIGQDGVQRVSDLAIADLTRKLQATGSADPNWIAAGAGPYADNFDSFEWLPSEVVVHFDPYAVASYADGPQEVHIPLSRLADVLRPDPRAPLPSFDCANAGTDVENAICSDQMLAQLDRRVAEAYAMRLRLEALGNSQPTVQAQQIQWLAQRDADCSTAADAALVNCLDSEYADRLTALRNFN
jgi:peptidoglycan-N-acetylglucosamine deacetylase